ncbi:MAG TPA: hypothetical protein VGM19_11360 [Armatimonadota bacterium]|jgi:hypothetical protein
MRPDHPHYETIQQVNRHLHQMLVFWGLIPLGVALIVTIVLSLLRGGAESGVPEQLALGFKGVMAAGGALFLIGFWLDGRWTECQRLAQMVYTAAGGNGSRPSRSQLAAQADLVMHSLMVSTKALTVVGLLIGLAAVLGAAAGLRFGYGAQIFLLALAFQVFIFSRHPYYREVMLAALNGELEREEPEPKKGK